jgi:hypothetical protein
MTHYWRVKKLLNSVIMSPRTRQASASTRVCEQTHAQIDDSVACLNRAGLSVIMVVHETEHRYDKITACGDRRVAELPGADF